MKICFSTTVCIYLLSRTSAEKQISIEFVYKNTFNN